MLLFMKNCVTQSDNSNNHAGELHKQRKIIVHIITSSCEEKPPTVKQTTLVTIIAQG